jgi:hypothetical protein
VFLKLFKFHFSKNKFLIITNKKNIMKKLILLTLAAIVTVGSYAQSGKTDQPAKRTEGKTIQDSKDKHPDGYMLQNGKMVVIKDGKFSNLNEDFTLSNGTVIKTDGTYVRKGGTAIKFKEGEHMDSMGKFVPMDK